MHQPLVFVDLETTGAVATGDRITEIGIVEVSDAGVSEWSTLVNPQTRISDFIERLTGISNAMVADAPTFVTIAEEVLERLRGRLFIAHNARFDYGFLKNEFKRAGCDFRATVLCTVKLSRRLYPGHARHNLDALIERHGLKVSDRHRALGDARLLWQFWQKTVADLGEKVVDAEVAALTARPSLPPHFDANVLDEIPEGHGVYLFYAENNLPLFIGKSKTLRKRVLAHFSADHASAKDMSLSQQVRRIEWIETSGELGALLKEAELVKKLQPTHNHRLRRNDELCSLRLNENLVGKGQPEVIALKNLPAAQGGALYGLFNSPRAAIQALRSIAEQHQLCLAMLGIENVASGRSCFAYQLRSCSGACVGTESVQQHQLRLITALQAMALKTWPHPGPVGVKEGGHLHIINQWRYRGTAVTEADVDELLGGATRGFDADIYKLLVKHFNKRTTSIVPLHRRGIPA